MDDPNRKGPLLAAVEGGGTTFLLTVAVLCPAHTDACIPHTRFEVLHQSVIPSSHSPSQTLDQAIDFFRLHRPPNDGYDALGIASFGPVGVNPQDKLTYGRILNGSPKKMWRNVDLLTPLLSACSSEDGKHVPAFCVDTDVNAPAMAEFQVRNDQKSKALTSLAYITVGTGIGVGLVINSQPVHGMMHPEGGHVPIVPLIQNDTFQGYSWGKDHAPFQGKNTVEGMASSVALSERWMESNKSSSSHANDDLRITTADQCEGLQNISDQDPIWDHAANAIASLCTTLILITSVETIVLGGGVMKRTILFEKVRHQTRDLLNGYLDLPQVTTDVGLAAFITPSVWSTENHNKVTAGLVGALTLAQMAYEKIL